MLETVSFCSNAPASPRHVRTIIYDIDDVKIVHALSHGYEVAKTLHKALEIAGIIYCATGNLALKCDDFRHIRDGAYLATVTSSDDELKISDLKDDYKITHVTDYITRYKNKDHKVFLMNRGQAVNFLHGAAVGPFIYLIQAEIVASINELFMRKIKHEITENSCEVRVTIARVWLKYFNKNN